MKRKVIAALVGCFVGGLPLIVKLPYQSALMNVVGYAVLLLAAPGVVVGAAAAHNIRALFWIALFVNTILYGCLAFVVLKAVARRRAHKTRLLSTTTD